ncbi:nuclease NucT [Serratia fonticola]|uniref:phospholipase D-like domain-containing protein n=1 Tax=Serratia fonticola TaxID=47917 RepID=UPI0021832426|nr:phospholipase D-like domain-containing protein [Serratia fonticola]CAI2111849.1 nuclease NucT [Serratia fonticola]
MSDSHYLLLPIYRGVVHAQIEKGEQWNEIEHLILHALCTQQFTLTELSQQANLPQVMAVEIIVRLMRAGWVELLESNNKTVFKATNYGLSVVEKERLPAVTRVIPRPINFVIDLISGGVYLAKEFSMLLSPNKAQAFISSQNNVGTFTILSPSIRDNDLPGDLDVLSKLVARPDEIIVGINAERSWASKSWYAKLTVTADQIEGIPAKGAESLCRLILNENEQRMSNESEFNYQQRKASMVLSCAPPFFSEHRINRSELDIIVGGHSHEQCLHDTLRMASRWVIIHSTFIDAKKLEIQMEALKEAASRGVKIDIFWDKSEEDGALNKLKECKDLLKSSGIAGRVHIHDFSTHSHAKMLIADNGGNEYFVVLGSCNWLLTGFSSTEVSLRIRHPRFVFDCLSTLEKLMSTPGKIKGTVQNEILSLGLRLLALPIPSPGNLKVRLLATKCHEEMIRRARDEAIDTIFLASHKLGGVVENQVLISVDGASRTNSVDVTVYYERTSGPAREPNIIAELKSKYNATVCIKHKKNAHAKFLTWDSDNIVVTSLNWLSKDASEKNVFGELGVYINGPGLAEELKRLYIDARR